MFLSEHLENKSIRQVVGKLLKNLVIWVVKIGVPFSDVFLLHMYIDF